MAVMSPRIRAAMIVPMRRRTGAAKGATGALDPTAMTTTALAIVLTRLGIRIPPPARPKADQHDQRQEDETGNLQP
jgi:hypothetical protein